MNLKKLTSSLFKPIDISSLALFRVLFGAIMLWEVTRYFHYGWIEDYWIQPGFFFTYDGFHWLQPWGGEGMYWHFFILGILAFFISIGFLYKISMSLFFVGFTYIFLLDKSNYLNHFYLISLIAFLMIWLPAHRNFSIDSWLRPKIKADFVPAWTRGILVLQLGIAYFFGGIAKLNTDWLSGKPMDMWLRQSTDFPILGQFFTEKWMAMFFSYGGLFFDLLIIPLLLWKKTRWWGVLAMVFFHITNATLFQIGIFPWFMLACLVLFFPSDWFRNAINKFQTTFTKLRFLQNEFSKRKQLPKKQAQFPFSKLLLAGLSLYFLIQIAVPLRHYFIPGNVNWTEEGHRFSWHMKLRDKNADAIFLLKNPKTQEEWQVHPRQYLTPRQKTKMSIRPDMILQFSQYLEKVYEQKGHEQVHVQAIVYASLNGRERQFLINPEINLAQADPEHPAPWIVPLIK